MRRVMYIKTYADRYINAKCVCRLDVIYNEADDSWYTVAYLTGDDIKHTLSAHNNEDEALRRIHSLAKVLGTDNTRWDGVYEM